MTKNSEFQALEEREWALFSERGDFFSRWFGLPVSLRITNVYLKLGLNENHASISMLVAGLIGAALMILGSLGIFFGALFLLLHHLLDYVDGQLARHHGRASVKGAVLDRWNHFVVETATFPCLALGLYFQNGQVWPWIAVWILYIWNRFRVLLAQLPANILSEELSRYPILEREMMRSNLAAANSELTASSGVSNKQRGSSAPTLTSRIRSSLSGIRVASTSYNGLTILLGLSAALDLLANYFFSVNGVINFAVIFLGAYSVFNIIDYSWTYICSDRVASELSCRLESSSD